ncbi:MAG TPA: RNA-binding S4 domain-containing protein [Candidatus Binatia bacterium]|nr:RNA-binding S4 domain-containing protein [Candidatus Binatia bacterium]
MAEQSTTTDTVRLDRWLWSARFYKSRALAAEACDGGKVEVNGHPAKPHKLVRVHDTVSFTHPGGRKELKVLALAERRGPASVARLLYEDHSPPPPPREDRPFRAPPPFRAPGMGRPTKRERRETERLRGRT